MTPYFSDDWVTVYHGDALHALKSVPDGSAHCCVTSPPYWGLRDYGTATWEGGDPECDHIADASKTKKFGNPAFNENRPSRDETKVSGYYFDKVCGKCGAKRVDNQLGLEPTPEAYVENMVKVFREVRRILRDDGVLFLNLGDSYAGSLAIDPQLYKLRDDITEREKTDVILEMFGVWFDGNEASGKGPVSEVLPTCDEGSAVCVRSDMAGEGVTEELPPQQGEASCFDAGEAASTQVGRNQGTGRGVRVLRGICDGVSDGGSHQRGRCCSQEGPDREEPVEQRQDLQGYSQSGIPEGKVPGAVLQLQLRDRVLGILSSHTFKANEIPNSARFAFAPVVNLKPKDLCGIPWRVAFALQADGWWLRSDIIWAKPNPMPESVRDRPTKSHEYIFLLTKADRYFYDSDAVAEPLSESTLRIHTSAGVNSRAPGARWKTDEISGPRSGGHSGLANGPECSFMAEGTRNRRTVWTIATKPYPEAHFAVFPPELPEICIKAGCPEDGTVLDPFAGAGTTLWRAKELGRKSIGVELNEEYIKMSLKRMAQGVLAL